MYAQVEQTNDNKSKAASNSFVQKKGGGLQGRGIVDNRRETISQRKLQDIFTHCRQAKQTAQLQAMPDNRNHPGKDVHQLKISIASTMGGQIDDPLTHTQSKLPYYVSPNTILDEVLSTKPAKVRDAMDQEFRFGITYKHLYQWIEEWDAFSSEFTYTDDAKGFKKLTKDAIKYYLNQKLNWRSVGTAEYMTGDATGLAMAPTVDPDVTIKVLMGKQRKGPQMEDLASLFLSASPEVTESNKEIAGPSFLDKQKQLPDYFEEVLLGRQVVMSDTGTKKKYQGTSDRYSKSYNINTPGTTKPWNKETWEATRIIGEAFKDEEKREQIRNQIRLGDASEDEGKKRKIEKYKAEKLDPTLSGQPCILLWGRASGQKGGAHKELDSHKMMVIQLARFVLSKFPNHMLVFVGDEVVEKRELAEEEVQNKVVFMGEFWKPDRSGEEYAPSLRDRNSQRYLFQLLASENKAVSIGMRSGSLEGMALLGLPVIFIDDKGNNAAERMEFWAGSAADDRSDALWFNQDNLEEMAEWEKGREGPMANYKRLATHLMMGDEIDKRTSLLNTGKPLLEFILTGTDHGGIPICTGKGKGEGATITGTVTKLEYKLTLLDKKMPADPQLVKDFLKDYETVINFITNTNYMGQTAGVKSSFYFDSLEITTIEHALEGIETNPAIELALRNLSAIKETKNVGGQDISGKGKSSSAASGLIGILLASAQTNAIRQEEIEKFNVDYTLRSRGFAGKRVNAAGAKVKFIKTHIADLIKASEFLLSKNLLQHDELKQVEFLVGYLSKDV